MDKTIGALLLAALFALAVCKGYLLYKVLAALFELWELEERGR